MMHISQNSIFWAGWQPSSSNSIGTSAGVNVLFIRFCKFLQFLPGRLSSKSMHHLRILFDPKIFGNISLQYLCNQSPNSNWNSQIGICLTQFGSVWLQWCVVMCCSNIVVWTLFRTIQQSRWNERMFAIHSCFLHTPVAHCEPVRLLSQIHL